MHIGFRTAQGTDEKGSPDELSAACRARQHGPGTRDKFYVLKNMRRDAELAQTMFERNYHERRGQAPLISSPAQVQPLAHAMPLQASITTPEQLQSFALASLLPSLTAFIQALPVLPPSVAAAPAAAVATSPTRRNMSHVDARVRSDITEAGFVLGVPFPPYRRIKSFLSKEPAVSERQYGYWKTYAAAELGTES